MYAQHQIQGHKIMHPRKVDVKRRWPAGILPDHAVFVGDLSPDVTDYLLQETFARHFASVRSSKVSFDAQLVNSPTIMSGYVHQAWLCILKAYMARDELRIETACPIPQLHDMHALQSVHVNACSNAAMHGMCCSMCS